MYEIGLDLRIKGGKIILRYNGQEYEIQSNPREPDIYICQGDYILHTVRCGFYTSQIEKMILRDKEYASVTGRMIGRQLLSDALACTIDDGRSILDFAYVTKLALQRREKRHDNRERINKERIEERAVRLREKGDMEKYKKPKSPIPDDARTIFLSTVREEKRAHDMISDGRLAYGVFVGRFLFNDGKVVVYAISDLQHIGTSDVFMTYQITIASYLQLLKISEKDSVPQPAVPATLTDSCRIGFLCGESAYCKRGSFTLDDVDMAHVELISRYEKMPRKYFFHGESEREFYLTFTMAHDLDEYYIRVGEEKNIEPDEPLGNIIVPKEYENSWITQRRYYLDWEVVVAPVVGANIKGYNYPYWKLLKDNTGAEMNKYAVFQNPEGRIVATTPLTELDIAETLEEYLQMSEEQISSMCYRSEMSRAR